MGNDTHLLQINVLLLSRSFIWRNCGVLDKSDRSCDESLDGPSILVIGSAV